MIASASSNSGQRIGDDGEAAGATTGERARVMADPGRILALQRADELGAVGLVDRPHDHAAHSAGGAADDQPDLGHCAPLKCA